MLEFMPIKWRLAAVLADREMSYLELAEKTGMHRVTINKMKNTFDLNFRLTPATLGKLCHALECQPGELLKYIPEDASEDSSDE